MPHLARGPYVVQAWGRHNKNVGALFSPSPSASSSTDKSSREGLNAIRPVFIFKFNTLRRKLKTRDQIIACLVGNSGTCCLYYLFYYTFVKGVVFVSFRKIS